MAFHKSLCALLAAATISYSTPAWGDTPAPSCEERVEGAVRIEKTEYCADRFGAIYGAAGNKLQNPRVLLRIQRSPEYKEAKEGANALYLQLEAVRQSETSLGLEEQVKKEQLRKKEESPPPYLQPGYQESPSPDYATPSPSSVPEQRVDDKSNNMMIGTVWAMMGLGSLVLGAYMAGEENPESKDNKYVGGGLIAAGLAFTVVGVIYWGKK